MLGFQGGVSIPLVKGGVKAPPAKRQCRAGPKAGARRGFTCMRGAQVAGHTAPVRYEPYDMGVAYAYIGGQWLACVADVFALVHGRSEREWHGILEEWREQQRQHGRKRITLNGPLLGQFLPQLEGDEALLLQHQRDLEEQAQRSALLPGARLCLPPRDEPPQIAVELTTIRSYEAYRECLPGRRSYAHGCQPSKTTK